MFYSVATCFGIEINHHQARYSHSKAGKNAKYIIMFLFFGIPQVFQLLYDKNCKMFVYGRQ